MTFYAQMQGVASELLQEFDQGGLALVVTVPGGGPAHNPLPPTQQEVPFTGTARGVTGEHLQDSLIQSSDLSVIMPGHLNPTMTDKVMVNGKPHNIIKIIPKPAAGTPAVYELVVRK